MKKDTYYDLTNPQKSIWDTEQFYKGTCINNICGTSIVNEVLDFNLLEQSINIVVKNNDSFRLKFVVKDNDVKQYLSEYNFFNIDIIDVSSLSELNSFRENIISTPFNLNDSILFKFFIFRFKNNYGAFMLNIHHLISDAWTLGFISNEIITTYSDLKHHNSSTSCNTYSYIDYIKSEESYLSSKKFLVDKSYWESQFPAIPELACIPSSNRIVSKFPSSIGNRRKFLISKTLFNSIHTFCNNNNVSMFNFFMSIFSIYISKVTNLDEFVIGTPILNRKSFKEKHSSGMYISTVPFKVLIEHNNDFCTFIKSIGTTSLNILRHQQYPYQNIIEYLRQYDSTLPNLYDILISYQITNARNNSTNIDYITEWTFNGNCSDSLNIHIYDINDIGDLCISYDYQINKYTSSDITNLHTHILQIIEQVINNPYILLKDIDILTPEEKQQLLYEFNDTYIKYNSCIPIIKHFENQVLNHPKDIALVFEKGTITYEMLNEKANSLAYLLRKKGVTNNTIVGIMENRSFEMIIAILAVLKSGGAYIPIDPDYPKDRISYMLKDSNAYILLSEKSLENRINFDKEVIYITLNNSDIYSSHTDNLPNISNPNDLSYIIYTSGSTGEPKGVMLTHKNLSNFYSSMLDRIEYLRDGSQFSIVSITTLSFDIFIFETLISLTRGLKLFITDYYEQKITSKLERLISENHIDIIQSTPSIMQFHIDNLDNKNSFSKLKYIILAGEQLPKRLVDTIRQLAPSCTIYNGYGPSETTIFSTIQNVTNIDRINIGKPIGNTQIYILDKNKQLLPIGIPGEIYIGGDGVGKGYLNRETLSSKKYIPNPYKKNSIIYKTGDVGMWLPDGTIECKGRIDNQIKLRGLRIELEEIEEKINSYIADNTFKSAVIIKNDNNKSSLHAFISYDKEIDFSKLKKYLLKYLPSYMLPNTYTLLDKLPLTPNGKIDRKVLQSYNININSLNDNYSAPRNKTEELLVNSISRKLNVNDFGIDSNIFDYGADSLSIISILTDLFKYNFNLKVYDLYKYPTVRELYDNLLDEKELRKNLDVDKFSFLNTIVSNFSTNTDSKKIYCKYNILLTGATGFLGGHILSKLLDNIECVNKIYCTMRVKDYINSKDRLLNKIHFYFGNKYDDLIQKHVILVESQISDDNFGLSSTEYDSLLKNVDLVIHSAANVKHYGKYSDFEKINVIGTKNIVTFCKKAKCPLHYISTMTVSGNYLLKQDSNSSVYTENSFYENQKFDQNVYSKSKLLAEAHIIENINDGLIATIYRIGDLTGRYSDGVFQENINENSIYLRLKSILEIGNISESILYNKLEFTPVDYAADAIFKIIWSNNNQNRIFSIYNPNMISTKDLIDYISTDNYKINLMSQSEFISYIKNLSMDQNSQSKLSGIINDFTQDNDFIYNYTIKQNNDITCRYLKNLDFNWPHLNSMYFSNLLQYMKKVNFIK